MGALKVKSEQDVQDIQDVLRAADSGRCRGRSGFILKILNSCLVLGFKLIGTS